MTRQSFLRNFNLLLIKIASTTLIPGTVICIRYESLLDNAMLPLEHDRLVGNAILQRFDELYGATEASLTFAEAGSRLPPDVDLASLQQLVKLFLINGFAWDGSAAIVRQTPPMMGINSAAGTQFTWTFTSPATLWSGKALQLRKATPTNDFVRKAATSLLLREGYRMTDASVKYTQTEEITMFKIL